MLPGVDGLEICRRIRVERPATLVLMLTAKTSEIDRVLGLEIGADDYLNKPFSMRGTPSQGQGPCCGARCCSAPALPRGTHRS